ncbi:hypothetical protein QYF36_000312 [Acer negundo]|nr:hypothetical protein QYF36_000312 [Acer negundo]
MEIPLLRYQSMSLDQIQSGCSSIPVSLSDNKVFKGRSLFDRRKWKNPFTRIKCCSILEQGLKPRPKPNKIDVEELKESKLPEAPVKKPSAGFCSQIEKLVLNRKYREALELFEVLEFEGGFDVGTSTYDALVSACIGLKSIREVKRIYNYMLSTGFEPDLYMRNRVLFMHVKMGMMIDARKLFEEMPERNVVSWNIVITGLVDSGGYLEAFRLFLVMWEELSDGGSRIYATMIRAAAGLGLISVAKQLHSCAVKMGVSDDGFVSCALINMYSKCGSIEDAQGVFDEMPEKTTCTPLLQLKKKISGRERIVFAGAAAPGDRWRVEQWFWSDSVYKWNEKGQMPNTGRANWKKRWSCCSEYDEKAPMY